LGNVSGKIRRKPRSAIRRRGRRGKRDRCLDYGKRGLLLIIWYDIWEGCKDDTGWIFQGHLVPSDRGGSRNSWQQLSELGL